MNSSLSLFSQVSNDKCPRFGLPVFSSSSLGILIPQTVKKVCGVCDSEATICGPTFTATLVTFPKVEVHLLNDF